MRWRKQERFSLEDRFSLEHHLGWSSALALH